MKIGLSNCAAPSWRSGLRPGRRAFSLVELLTVVAIFGILGAILVPMITEVRGSGQVIATAADFRTFAQAFRSYALLEGGFPPDCHETVPAGVGMEDYLAPMSFEREAAIGGRYNWEGPDYYPYAGISLTSTTATPDELGELDQILDDGNLAAGWFRQTPNGRYTYILQEQP